MDRKYDIVRLIKRVQRMGKTNACQDVARFFKLPYELTWRILMGRDISGKAAK